MKNGIRVLYKLIKLIMIKILIQQIVMSVALYV